MTLGTRIKEYRLKAKLSQEKVAELVGVSRQAVTKWESDQSSPNMDNLFHLAEIFGTTVDALVTDETDDRSVAEMVYRMIQEDKARQRAQILATCRQRVLDALKVLLCYLIIYVVCKLLWSDRSDMNLTLWMLNYRPDTHAPTFGHLMFGYRFWRIALISVAAALLGLKRLTIITIAAFVIALPLGEYLGDIAGLVPEGRHWGYKIWQFIFCGSVPFGIWLQCFKPEELVIQSRKMKCWILFASIYIIAVIILILLGILY